MIVSRFSSKYVFAIFAILSVSFVLSLFLLQLLGAILFLLWLFEKWDNKSKSFDTLLKLIFIFGFVRLISVVFSSYPSSSNAVFYKEALFYTSALSFFFYIKSFDKKTLVDLLSIFIAGAVAMSVVGILKFSLGIVERAEGFSSSYTVFSAYLLTALSIALFYPTDKNKKFKEVIRLLSIILLFIGIIVSLGRTNIAVAVLIFVSAVLFKKVDIKSAVIIIATLLILISLYYISNRQTINNNVTDRIENISYLSDRDIIWKGAKEILFNKPFLGYGPRTFNEIFPLRDEFSDKRIGGWHNDALQIYFESGLLGLSIFLFLLVYILYISVKLVKSKTLDDDYKKIAQAVLCSIISLFLSGITAGFITSVVLSIVFVFLLSVLSRIEFERTINK